MNILQIVQLTNTLVHGLSDLGFSLSNVAALQADAEEEGRDLSVEDFKKLRDGARARLDALDKAIEDAEAEEAMDNGLGGQEDAHEE